MPQLTRSSVCSYLPYHRDVRPGGQKANRPRGASLTRGSQRRFLLVLGPVNPPTKILRSTLTVDDSRVWQLITSQTPNQKAQLKGPFSSRCKRIANPLAPCKDASERGMCSLDRVVSIRETGWCPFEAPATATAPLPLEPPPQSEDSPPQPPLRGSLRDRAKCEWP
jgi:hypothetical protein